MHLFLKIHHISVRFDGFIQEWAGSLMSAVIRMYCAWQFFKAGMLKISNWDATLALFAEEYSVPLLSPEIAAYAGTSGELVFSVLLIVGLFSRPAALGLFIVNLMAVISYPQLLSFECPAAINDHFYWGFLLLVCVAFGAGKFSVDAWLKKRQAIPG